MAIPDETIRKMQALPDDRMNIVIGLVDQLSAISPLDIFDALCEDGGRNPMSEKEIDDLVSSVRTERNAVYS